MKWAYGIRRKTSAALLLAAIFVLLFAKNMVDKKNVDALGTSFSSVYEDRLLVESYIYRMSEHLFRKKIIIDSVSSRQAALQVKPAVDQYNENILNMIAAYGQTKLTSAEILYFEDLKRNIAELMELEQRYFRSLEIGDWDEGQRGLLDVKFNQASSNLDLLSGIQISEGKLLNENSQKIVAGSSILTQFEIGILVAIALMIMVLVFESTAMLSKTAQNQSLN